MAIIAQPSQMRLVHIDWTLDRPAQVNRSQWTGRDQVIANPWHGRWSAQADFAPIVQEANIRAWRAFLAKLKGQINTFRLRATEGAQAVYNATVYTGGVAAGGTTMLINNSDTGISPSLLKAGMMITLADQLLVLTADETPTTGGQSNIVFEPPVRAAATSGTAIETKNPTCLVALADSSFTWSADKGQVYGISLALEERF